MAGENNQVDLVLSERHFWQNCDAVYQVLVFRTEEDKLAFKAYFDELLKTTDLEHANDSHPTVLVKLRAILNNKGKWGFVVRNNRGCHIYEKETNFDDKDIAMDNLIDLFQEHFAMFKGLLDDKQQCNPIADL